MKFGYCSSMGAKDSAGIGYDRIPALKRLGYDYVEFPVAGIMALSDPSFEEGPLKAVEENSFPCLRMNVFSPASIRVTGPDADLDKALAYASGALLRARRLGAQVIVFGSSGSRNVPCAMPAAEGLRQFASFLQSLAPMAESFGITIAIEPLNKQETNLVNHFPEACALARQINHPNIGVLADTFHMGLGNEPVTLLAEAGALLRHVHVARVLGRALPCPGDGEDYGLLFATLRRIGYDGCISMEAHVQNDFEHEAGQALRHLREAMESA